MLVGGVIMKRVGLSLKTIPRFSVVMLTISTLLCVPLFFMGCPTHQVSGVNHYQVGAYGWVWGCAPSGRGLCGEGEEGAARSGWLLLRLKFWRCDFLKCFFSINFFPCPQLSVLVLLQLLVSLQHLQPRVRLRWHRVHLSMSRWLHRLHQRPQQRSQGAGQCAPTGCHSLLPSFWYCVLGVSMR